MKLKMIFCTNEKGYIGYRGNLLYSFEEDMKSFKKITKDSTVIMGFKTYQEIGKPLKNRTNIVVVNFNYPMPDFPDNVIIVKSLQDACIKAQEIAQDTFIIGGGKLYSEAMNTLTEPFTVDEIYVTLVKDDLDGDTKSPDIPYVYEKEKLDEVYDINRLDNQEYLLEFYKYSLKAW